MSDLSLQEIKKEWHGSYRAYAIGFISSLLLTSLSFLLVIERPIQGPFLIGTVVGLALLQAILQLLLFLHVGQEAKPRWETVVFWFMTAILLLIALGSLWIMYDLDNRLMIEMEMPHD